MAKVRRAPKHVETSARLYRAFREADPKRAKAVRIKLPKSVMVIGHLEFVGYSTTHAGVARLYKHKFARGSRPLLCAGPGRNQLFIIGGRHHFTGRGIVDLTPKGREIDD